MKKTVKTLLLGLSVPLLTLVDYSPEAPCRLELAREAAAIVGVPFSPVSVAGVARRTTYRAVAATSASAAAASSQQQAAAKQQAATAQQQQAVAQQQAATAQQQQAIAQQQAAAAQQLAQSAPRPAGAPAIGSVVHSLPEGCVSAPKGGVEYYQCGGVYYRAAFQGNNLVYVVQQP
jgi:hypothetical protein